MSESRPKHFLFLEIEDPDFNAFYDDLSWILTGTRPIKPPHLTVRGPYKNPIPRDEVERYRQHMQYAVLKIAGLGTFSNPDEEVVFLSVDSPQLREIWWKPDYPIGSSGFNPHISIYRGPDSALAYKLAHFQPLHAVSYLCAEYALVPVVKDRNSPRELPVRTFRRAREHLRLQSSKLIPSDFFAQLEALVNGRPGEFGSQMSLFDE